MMVAESIMTFIHTICGAVVGSLVSSILLGRRLKLKKKDILAMWVMLLIPMVTVVTLVHLLHLYVFKRC